MKIASVAAVKAGLSAYLRASEKGPIVITKNGKPAGVLLSALDDDELERILLAYSPRLNSILDAAHERIRKGTGISHEEIWATAQPTGKKRRSVK